MNSLKHTATRWLLPLALIALSASAPINFAVAADVGYVDARRLIDDSPQGAQILKELEAEFAERNREIKGKSELLRSKQQDLEKNRVTMSAEEVRNKAEDLREMQRQLLRARREYDEDFTRRRNQRVTALEKVITEVIVKVAKREKLEMVFQQAVVVYASSEIDLTERVLKELKKQFKK